MPDKTYMTEARLRGLVASCNKHGAQLALKTNGKTHVLERGGVAVTPSLKAGFIVLYLNGFLANVDASTRRRR